MTDFPGLMSMPRTRYQGSKRKLLPWLAQAFSRLSFSRCLDAFGGTGAVTHLFRCMGKEVTYLDILWSNEQVALALFSSESAADCIDAETLRGLFSRRAGITYASTISRMYQQVYFTDEENRQLDILCQNIPLLDTTCHRAQAYYCLFQSALSKRPYNLFHRANLNMRQRTVRRSFGNKVTWERPFLDHMLSFLSELQGYYRTVGVNDAMTVPVTVRRGSAFDCVGEYDLVYIDTPYAKGSGAQESNYFNYYHFLDACTRYDCISNLAIPRFAHKPIYDPRTAWYPVGSVHEAFSVLFHRFSRSIVVVSYRDDGVPSVAELVSLMGRTHVNVSVSCSGSYGYALASKTRKTQEVLVVGHPDAT